MANEGDINITCRKSLVITVAINSKLFTRIGQKIDFLKLLQIELLLFSKLIKKKLNPTNKTTRTELVLIQNSKLQKSVLSELVKQNRTKLNW